MYVLEFLLNLCIHYNRFEKFENYFLTFVVFTEYVMKETKQFNTSSWA